MKRDPVRASVLSSKIIPNVSPELAKKLGLSPEHKSLALLTTDCDDVGYTAIDEATKKADVSVVYAKSFYGGAARVRRVSSDGNAGNFDYMNLSGGVRPTINLKADSLKLGDGTASNPYRVG